MRNHPAQPGLLLLEDGRAFRGVAHSPGTTCGEVVFNTSMTGYQEVLTDPSYRRQIVVMTLPHIGNYGISAAAAESRQPWVEGFIARRFTARASSPDSEEDLLPYLNRHHIPALSGIDTRALVRHLREQGAMRGLITDQGDDLDRLREQLLASPTMTGRALVDEVTCDEAYILEPTSGPARTHVALYDFGTKRSIPASLAARGARVTVLPAHTPAAECRGLGVDGVVLSNGPGDPAPLAPLVATVRELLDAELPVFGICLGHQLLGLALGGRTFKLPFGHHGGNQPVQELGTGKVTITSQNHGFAVAEEGLPEGCIITHRNLNDGTVEGLALRERPVYAVQYHPEAAPGPHEARALFDQFLDRIAS